jgi:hypothetical protein
VTLGSDCAIGLHEQGRQGGSGVSGADICDFPQHILPDIIHFICIIIQ